MKMGGFYAMAPEYLIAVDVVGAFVSLRLEAKCP